MRLTVKYRVVFMLEIIVVVEKLFYGVCETIGTEPSLRSAQVVHPSVDQHVPEIGTCKHRMVYELEECGLHALWEAVIYRSRSVLKLCPCCKDVVGSDKQASAEGTTGSVSLTLGKKLKKKWSDSATLAFVWR